MGISSGIGKDDSSEMKTYEGASVWVSACINQWVRDISNVNYFFVDKKGERLENVTDDIVDPIKKGYAGIDISSMIGVAGARLLLCGNDIWVKNRGLNQYNTLYGTVGEFCIVPSGQWKINMAWDWKSIASYEVNFGNGNMATYQPQDVIHFKDGNLLNPWIGTGRIAQARSNVESEKVSIEYQNNFFQSDGNPSLIYVDKGVSNVDQAKSRGQLVKDNYDAKRYSKSLMYAFGDVDIKALSASANDLQYIETKKLNREAIISIMGSTPAVLGLEGESGNRSISTNSTNNYYKRVNSFIFMLVQTINEQYFYIEGKKRDIGLSFEPYATGDIEEIGKGVEKGIITLNEARKYLGYEVDEKDLPMGTHYISRGFVPLQMAYDGLSVTGMLSQSTSDVKKNSIY